jgi:RimJ/RimL family protein N-acetyltransferase
MVSTHLPADSSPNGRSIIFAETPRLSICVLDHESHLQRLCGWFNDVRVTRTLLLEQRPVSKESERDWLIRLQKPDCAMFLLEKRDDRTPIGIGGVHYIDWTSRNARIFIVIGEPQHWRQQYATEFREWLITYAFKTLNLHKLSSHVAATNTAAIRMNTRFGFTLEGTLRDQLFRNGKYQAVLIYSTTTARHYRAKTRIRKGLQSRRH